jgi:hypothetical protein
MKSFNGILLALGSLFNYTAAAVVVSGVAAMCFRGRELRDINTSRQAEVSEC